MMNMDAPTATGKIGVRSGKARSSQRNELSSGTTSCTWGSQEYRRLERPTRLSGVDGRVCRMAWYSPIQMGNCMKKGPRQPIGLTPASLYTFIVSEARFCRSSPYLSWIALSLGWSTVMALSARLCLTVSGNMAARMRMVNTTMVMPKLRKKMLYSITRLLIIGSMTSVFHMEMMTSIVYR